MNLLLPTNLENQAPHKQFLWLLVVVLACISIFTTISLAVLLLMGYSPDNIGDVNLKELGYGQLQAYKILQMLSTVGLFLLPAILYSYLHYSRWNFLPLKKGILPTGVALTLLTVLGGLPIVGWLGEINAQMQLPEVLAGIENWMKESEDDAQEMIITFLQMNNYFDLFVNILMIALLPAIAEEALFRGTLQPILHRWLYNPHWAIVIAAFLFSFIHLQFYGFLPRMVLGIILGYLFLFSQNIWYPIMAHFVYNGMQVLLIYFFPEELEKMVNSTTQTEHIPLPLVGIGAGVLISALLSFMRVYESTLSSETVVQE